MWLTRFIAWARIKTKIHLAEREIYFREGEIWWTSLGVNIGHEQDGKNEYFERPVLILKKFGRYTLWAVPLSSRLKYSPYYFQYTYHGRNYSALLTQLRLISSKRLLRKVGVIDVMVFRAIKEKIKKLLQ